MKNINTNALELDSLESVVGGSQFGTKNLTIRTTGSSIGLPRYKVGQQVTVARIGATALEPGTIVGIGKGRGVNVFPSQIETVLLKEGYTPNYQIIVDRVNNTDTFDINVELAPEQFSDKLSDIEEREKSLAAAMRTMLGIGPKIHLCAPKTIARSEGKAVRVIDKRKLH